MGSPHFNDVSRKWGRVHRVFNPNIEKMVVPVQFANAEGPVIEVNENGFTMETEHKGKSFTVNVTYSENLFFDEEDKTVNVGDILSVGFLNAIMEDVDNPEAVLEGEAVFIMKIKEDGEEITEPELVGSVDALEMPGTGEFEIIPVDPIADIDDKDVEITVEP
jgi:hypothetical protein